MLDKQQLPFTSDLVFGTEGYNITFSKAEDTFEPAVPPPEDHDPMDWDGFGDGKGVLRTKIQKTQIISEKVALSIPIQISHKIPGRVYRDQL